MPTVYAYQRGGGRSMYTATGIRLYAQSCTRHTISNMKITDTKNTDNNMMIIVL